MGEAITSPIHSPIIKTEIKTMAQQKQEPLVQVEVTKRGNGKAAGVVFEGKVFKIGEKFECKKSDANYLVSTGKCILAAAKAEVKK
jgi:hypothetical protein